jgi:hypothetical protein
MKGNAFIGVSPENERWSLDGQKCVFDWNQIMNWELVTFFWNGLSKPELASQMKLLFEIRFQKNNNPDLYYYIDKGRLFSYSLKSKTSKNSISKAVRLLIYKWAFQECFISDKMKIFSVQYQ